MADELEVFVKFSLWVREGGREYPAGARLLKGNVGPLNAPPPRIAFNYDDRAEAQKDAKALQTYMRQWAQKHDSESQKRNNKNDKTPDL